MSLRQSLSMLRSSVALALVLMAALPAQAVTPIPEIAETNEIVFNPANNSYAQPLNTLATQLGNAVSIYEYVHNNFEFSAYHGSRSGSINTFNGQRGSDVDIATALIAMLRSQNIPARYAVGTIQLPVAQLINWLGMTSSGNINVAVQILQDQGIQGVTLAADGSTVSFEHVWVEVLVPFAQYRGLTTGTSIDCTAAANAALCNWIPLDGSFKQMTFKGLNIDPYNVPALNFDYNAYYGAIANGTVNLQNKNPLTILEEQLAVWLRTAYPGKTLDDVADKGQIIPINDGLLPASLPYNVTSPIRHYNSIALHDAVVTAVNPTEPKVWAKYLTITATILPTGVSTGLQGNSGSILLAQLNTQRLTLTTELQPASAIPFVNLRWGGRVIVTLISTAIPGYTPAYGDKYSINVSMDGTPDPTGGSNDKTIPATYSNAVVGGTYLVATGGESSNWHQVHNAADQLLYNDSLYKLVFNPAQLGSNGLACSATNSLGCTPYVDANSTGVYASNDVELWKNATALNDLTGGLLYVAATQYFANLREMFDRADHLMKTKTPIVGFLGVVSSTYDAEYINNTAFSILPGGLLIDMKGIRIGGSYRTNDTPVNFSNRQFEFIGHMVSSLEHETWQELTGYDAISTVRGIQMAVANGASVLNPVKNSTQDTLPGLYNSFLGFSTTVPAGFTYTPFTINNTAPATWTHATNGANFDVFLKTVNATTDQTHLTDWTYSYSSTNGLYAWSSCTANKIYEMNTFYTWRAPLSGYFTCAGTNITYFLYADAINTIYNEWANTIIPNDIGQTYFNFFDTQQGFSPSAVVYRNNAPNLNAYSSLTLATIRTDLYIPPSLVVTPTTSTPAWVSYTLPSTLVAVPNNHFEVDIRRIYSSTTGNLGSVSFEIHNLGQ